MLEIIVENLYLLMFIQVVVTTSLVPNIALLYLSRNSIKYCVSNCPNALTDLRSLLARGSLVFKLLSVVTLSIGLYIVWHAFDNQIELFNWDNQAGITVLFVFSLVPTMWVLRIQNEIFSLFYEHGGSIRTASLKVTSWISIISRPLLVLLIVGHLIYVSSVLHFVLHPFPGYAGIFNLLGLLFIDCVFVWACYFSFNNKKIAAINDSEYRALIRLKNVRFNLIAWVVALYYLSLSLWLSGIELKDVGLMVQSLYFQLVVVLAMLISILPRSSTATGQETVY